MGQNEQARTVMGNDFVSFVDFQGNRNLSEMEVSFHWWDAGHTSLHYHNHYEFFIITSGRTRHMLNGEQELLQERTLFFIHPKDVHQFSPVDDEKCIHINVSATSDRLRQLCAALGLPLAWLAGNPAPQGVRLTRDELAWFMHRAQQLNYLARDEGEQAAIQLTICEMLVQCVALTYKKRLLLQDNRPRWLHDLLERLHSPEYMACGAGDVYQLAGYSAPVVIRSFRRHTGGTVHAYLARLKMDWAVQLLATTDMTVLDVSQTLGYASLSHFGKLFTRHTGLCPRDFRARNAGSEADSP